MSNSLWPHGLQHTRLPCPSPSPRVCSNSCPLSQWYHLTITSSVVPFSCLQSFPASGSFPTSQLFASGGPSIGASASASGPSNEYSGLISLRIDWWISLLCKGLSRVFSNITVQKQNQKHYSIETRYLPWRSKEWFLWIQSPASSHTQKSAEFLNLEYLVLFN